MFIQFWDNKSECYFNARNVDYLKTTTVIVNGKRAVAWEVCCTGREPFALTKNRFTIEYIQEA